MVSATCLSSIFLLVAGVIVAVLQINRRAHDAQVRNRVQTPIMGGIKQPNLNTKSIHKEELGPWPICMGKSGDECCSILKEYVKKCIVLDVNAVTMMDYNLQRVWVHIDPKTNLVVKVPHRG
mmetsp:Transcript_25764/g.29450  ORF Transcript_25764/g.29450 Transcript_25764/m.29450 type:complete len:122 (+) Transcript_25764:78-443(+)